MPRVQRAIDRARALAHQPWAPVRPTDSAVVRVAVVGDPQSSLSKFMSVMESHGLLGEDGMLDLSVALVSVGDHFDYGMGEVAEAAVEGYALLRWLAAHAPDRVVILAGNHDLARVTEMFRMTAEGFASLRAIARKALDGDLSAAGRFSEATRDIPTPEVAWRDYGSFTVAQRKLVQTLLMEGRMQVALAGALTSGVPVLVTHAGVTQRELRLLGLPETVTVPVLAEALNERLRTAVAAVAPAWAKGELARLPLEPWHVVGVGGREGGGMFYHRPGMKLDPDDRRFGGEAPRRFEPTTLPRGLVQAVGHSGHRRNKKDLASIATPEALAHALGGLRTLRTTKGRAVYELGLTPPDRAEATMYLVDGEMHHVAAADVPVLDLHPSPLTTARAG